MKIKRNFFVLAALLMLLSLCLMACSPKDEGSRELPPISNENEYSGDTSEDTSRESPENAPQQPDEQEEEPLSDNDGDAEEEAEADEKTEESDISGESDEAEKNEDSEPSDDPEALPKETEQPAVTPPASQSSDPVSDSDVILDPIYPSSDSDIS